jgi:hypothetical protein
LKLIAIRSMSGSVPGANSKNTDAGTAMSKFIPTWRTTSPEAAKDLEIAIRDAVQT